MSLCNLIIGATAVGAAGTQAANNTLVAFTLLFIGTFAASWGPGAWVLIAELYPLKLRGKAMSMATLSNWFWNFIIAFIVPCAFTFPSSSLVPRANFGHFQTSPIRKRVHCC